MLAAVKAGLGFTAGNANVLEQALIGVRKTTGFSAEETDRLGAALLRMSARLGIGAATLAEYAEAGGQLGIRKGLLEFVEAAAKKKPIRHPSLVRGLWNIFGFRYCFFGLIAFVEECITK